ncbi:GNAT family N-acetyltransferase [Bowmanella denitrificans]|uniref:GNAT family N-acetyltransferase n=1 Tax=Bowmanella denitrificans TaxID=366582 RepID=UPI000C9A48DD|nr:GNAT family N-acetyltransferase [Bowmanella denitrificans]
MNNNGVEDDDQVIIGKLEELLNSELKASLKKFDCGDVLLNQFAKKQLVNKDENGWVRAFIAVHNNQVVGYITVRAHSLLRDRILASGPREFPSLMVDQLAVDKRYQSKGIGQTLLARAFQCAVIISKEAGIKGVTLWAHPRATNFYENLGMIKVTSATEQFGEVELQLMYINIEMLVQAYWDKSA